MIERNPSLGDLAAALHAASDAIPEQGSPPKQIATAYDAFDAALGAFHTRRNDGSYDGLDEPDTLLMVLEDHIRALWDDIDDHGEWDALWCATDALRYAASLPDITAYEARLCPVCGGRGFYDHCESCKDTGRIAA